MSFNNSARDSHFAWRGKTCGRRRLRGKKVGSSCMIIAKHKRQTPAYNHIFTLLPTLSTPKPQCWPKRWRQQSNHGGTQLAPGKTQPVHTSQRLCSTSRDLVHQNWHIRLYTQSINIYLTACPQDLNDCSAHVQRLRKDPSSMEEKREKSYSATTEYIFSSHAYTFPALPAHSAWGWASTRHTKYSVNGAGSPTPPTSASTSPGGLGARAYLAILGAVGLRLGQSTGG